MTKLGRNAPCWCNSGRKYKKCHGTVDGHDDPVQSTAAAGLEIAKALKEVRAIARPKDYDRIRSILASGHEAETSRAIAGIGEEDEFALLCRLMETTTHLVRLEQRPIVPGNHIVPDFMVRFQPGLWTKDIGPEQSKGFTCFVEVKSSGKDKFRIGGSLLAKRRAFAETFGHPLLFAVRFKRFGENAVWAIVEDMDRSKSSIHATVADWVEGVRPVLWNEPGFMLRPGTYFQATYTKEIRGKGITNSKHGELAAFQIVNGESRQGLKDLDASTVALLFEPFGLDEQHAESRGERTEVLYTTSVSLCSLADLLYRINRLPVDDEGNPTYDPAKILVELASGQTHGLMRRAFVEGVADNLVKAGVLFRIGYGSDEKNYETWRRLCG